MKINYFIIFVTLLGFTWVGIFIGDQCITHESVPNESTKTVAKLQVEIEAQELKDRREQERQWLLREKAVQEARESGYKGGYAEGLRDGLRTGYGCGYTDCLHDNSSRARADIQ